MTQGKVTLHRTHSFVLCIYHEIVSDNIVMQLISAVFIVIINSLLIELVLECGNTEETIHFLEIILNDKVKSKNFETFFHCDEHAVEHKEN
jgi:hypothetical protein